MPGKNRIIVAIILIAVLMVAIYAVSSKRSPDPNADPTLEIAEDDFLNQPYSRVKADFLKDGWSIPMGDARSDNFVSAGDPEFPEIGWCGTGLDAICNAAFVKNGFTLYLDVQMGGRSGYSAWTVVGRE